MNNKEIRQSMAVNGVRQWQVALACGYTESTFSRMMRSELDAEVKAKVLTVIEDIANKPIGIYK